VARGQRNARYQTFAGDSPLTTDEGRVRAVEAPLVEQDLDRASAGQHTRDDAQGEREPVAFTEGKRMAMRADEPVELPEAQGEAEPVPPDLEAGTTSARTERPR
jgi:hypothetical protein